MTDFIKNNKVILTIILLVGLALRLWDINSPEGIWNDEYFTYSISMFKFPFDFFEALRANNHAPLHSFYLYIWSSIFKNSEFMLRLSSLVPSILACFVMYCVGLNYQTKEDSPKIGLCCAAISAISAFLIYFSQEVRIYSMTFLLSSLVLLFSIKMYEFPSKKNGLWLLVCSILLILEHSIGFVYVLFNAFGLIAFSNKQKKKGKKKSSNDDFYMPVVAGLILCLPIIPFLFRIFAHPTYITQWWAPFNFSKICFYFTDLFSPVLRNITLSPSNFYNQIILNDKINAGFVMFAIIPSLIALFLIIKSNIESKKINKYFLAVFLATFLTVLIGSIADKIPFLTKYLTELYPLLILMCAIGWAKLDSLNSRISLATVYICMSLFYIIVSHLSEIQLIS